MVNEHKKFSSDDTLSFTILSPVSGKDGQIDRTIFKTRVHGGYIASQHEIERLQHNEGNTNLHSCHRDSKASQAVNILSAYTTPSIYTSSPLQGRLCSTHTIQMRAQKTTSSRSAHLNGEK